MDWVDKVNLQEYFVTAAPFGGHIAAFRDDRKSAGSQPQNKPTILLFSPHGDLKNSIKVIKINHYFELNVNSISI